jgi:hypothetical protein
VVTTVKIGDCGGPLLGWFTDDCAPCRRSNGLAWRLCFLTVFIIISPLGACTRSSRIGWLGIP